MDYIKEFEAVCQDHVKFRDLVAKGMAEADEASQFYLRELTKGLDATFAELKQKFPGAVSDLARRRQALEKAAEDSKAEVERVAREMKELKVEAEKFDAEQLAAAQPSAPAPDWAELAPAAPHWDDASLDADLRQYRVELLDLLSDGKKKDAAKKEDFREIWQDWSRFKE